MRSLVIAVAQPPVHPLDVAANVTRHASAVRAAAARVVIFPELSLTGYDLDAPLLRPDDPRLRPLVESCTATDTVALVGAPVPGPYIATLRIDAAGVQVVYRKQHPHHTEERFQAGPGPEVIEVDGWRLGLGICRDTGIEQQAAETAALGIDAYVAGLVDEPADDVVHAERARRISTTYGVWTAFASAAGASGPPFPATTGRSGIWQPDGRVAARAGRAPGEMARATLFAEQLARI
ncbi:carbon-nitrogen hydrolase family protein [Actinoplanes sp. NPDC049596]|uniref:carbon-nitrogen hydrolase family protein n=1 Tax=unclassified Actinoplanes TaxID=2626549 RepID=UPI0034147961